VQDEQIIELFWKRHEEAIAETSKKYSGLCYYISYNILHNKQDAKECVNDAFFSAWNSIPPNRPESLAAFLSKITRNAAIDKYKKYNAKKRGSGQMYLILSELNDCIPAENDVEKDVENNNLAKNLNDFLKELNKIDRIVFLRRYWYMSSIKEIAKQYGFSESKVKSKLFYIRKQLKRYLEKEGIVL